jgi:hypothetical protein
MAEYNGNSRAATLRHKPATRPALPPSTVLRVAVIAGIALVLALVGMIAQTISTGGFPVSTLLRSGKVPAKALAITGEVSPSMPEDGTDITYSPPIVERKDGNYREMSKKDKAHDYAREAYKDKAPDLNSSFSPMGTAGLGGSAGKLSGPTRQGGGLGQSGGSKDRAEPARKDGYFAPTQENRKDAETPREAKEDKQETTTARDDVKLKEVLAVAQEPVEMNRKIIRTGEMDFEIDSYEVAVVNITRLIIQIKGAFISDSKSAQLKSGKLQGYVVVRMPPQSLDQFILDLRRDLSKIGELKMQRINSQDVTKQYTDIESALKAARTMEERLLNIIKTGKGEIKDLITAENALGEWRTKIEKMEGEMRYYSNQVSLSTLTISLAEREPQTPFALATESISMRIEAEDVKKAHQTAEKAAIEAKGRVLRSEVKQHAAGQLEAILHVEVPPAARDGFAALLEKLGNVSQQESHRQQEARGGTGKPAEAIKPKEHDTHFEVTFNNLVNIAPRNSTTLQIATKDVAAGYAKLHEAIAQVKGQVRNTNLNETDSKNVDASIEFTVPTAHKQAIDKAIAEVGTLLTRNNVQAAITQLASERKFGYHVTLVNVANIPPREKTQLKFEVKNVDQTAAKLKELVAAAKGRITDARTQRRPNGEVAAILAFDVPLAAKDSLVSQFMETAKLIGQEEERTAQAPENDLAVAHLHVILAGESPIVPSDETFWAYLRTGFYTSFKIFAWCAMMIIIGVSAVLPWSLLIWGGYKLYSRMSRPAAAQAAGAPIALVVEPSPQASAPVAEDEQAPKA